MFVVCLESKRNRGTAERSPQQEWQRLLVTYDESPSGSRRQGWRHEIGEPLTLRINVTLADNSNSERWRLRYLCTFAAYKFGFWNPLVRSLSSDVMSELVGQLLWHWTRLMRPGPRGSCSLACYTMSNFIGLQGPSRRWMQVRNLGRDGADRGYIPERRTRSRWHRSRRVEHRWVCWGAPVR